MRSGGKFTIVHHHCCCVHRCVIVVIACTDDVVGGVVVVGGGGGRIEGMLIIDQRGRTTHKTQSFEGLKEGKEEEGGENESVHENN